MNKLRCAVIGVGYLGKFHAQKYTHLENADLIAVCDTDPEQAQTIAKQNDCQAYTNYQDLKDKVDAVSIAVPTRLHYEVAKFFLENRIHVLLEKPIATTVEEADELVRIANQQQIIFQIGHLERFNPAVIALNSVLQNPQFIESFRLATFKPRGTDVNVVLDLMIHDIDIIQDIVNSPITHISANGTKVLSKFIDVANARIEFENGCVANVTASRISLNNKRKLRIFQQDSYISINMQDKTLTTRHKGNNEMFPGVPEIVHEEKAFEQGDALLDEIVSFLDAITHRNNPVVTGEDGRRALKTAIEITRIVKQQHMEAIPVIS